MNTSEVLTAVIQFMEQFPSGSRGGLMLAVASLELMQKDYPDVYLAAIELVRKERNWAEVNEHLAADEERT